MDQQEIPRHMEHTQGAVDVLSTARALKRIANHATSIAEYLSVVVEDAVVRHQRS